MPLLAALRWLRRRPALPARPPLLRDRRWRRLPPTEIPSTPAAHRAIVSLIADGVAFVLRASPPAESGGGGGRNDLLAAIRDRSNAKRLRKVARGGTSAVMLLGLSC